ncbi:MAG: Arm DNA-binding domain-containing protein, partial [Succinivibrio sp.]|nr:Arm DNA-binding domain-containing protein [Succinivibrio sp.]
MTMGKMITAFELKAMLAEYPAKAVAEKRQFNFSLGGNVNLTIYKSGNNAFFARAKNETLRLGTYPEMSLSEARKKAKDFAEKSKRGNEGSTPHCNAGSDERSTITLSGMYEKFLEQYKGTGKNNKRYFNLRSYAKYLAPFGDKPLAALMPADVISGLKKFRLSANYSAAVFQGIKQSLDCAVLFGYLDRNPLSGFGRSRLNPFKRVPTGGFAWVKAEDLKTAFFAPLDGIPYVYRGLVLFAALSCCRIGEAQHLK